MQPQFVGVDDDRFGTGLTDLNTKSLSTLLENRINANTECLISNSHCVCRTLSSDNARNGRIWASLYPVSFFVGVFDVTPNTSKVTIDIAGAPFNGDIYTDTWIFEFRGGRPVPIGLPQRRLFDQSASEVTQRHEHDLPRGSFFGSKLVVAAFCKSVPVPGTLDNRFRSQITWTDPEITSYDGFRWENTNWDGWSQDTYIRDEDNGRIWQLLAHHTVTGKGGTLDGNWSGLQPLDGRGLPPEDATGIDGNYMAQRRMSGFIPYGVFVSFERNPDVGTFEQGRKAPESMWAQYPVLGQHASQHVINMDAEYKTYRTQVAGNGLIPQHDATWSSAYTYTLTNNRPNWPYKSGGPSGYTPMDTLTLDIDHASSRLEISGLLLGFEVHSIWTGENDWPGYPPSPASMERFEAAMGDQNALFNPTTQASDSIKRIVGNIPMQIKLSQLQTNDLNIASASYTQTFNFEQQVQFWRTTPDHTRPVLRQLDFMWHNDVFTNGRADIGAQYRATEKYGIQEGRLGYLNGHHDIMYTTPFTFTIDPTGYDPNLPLQVEILFGGTDKEDYYSIISEPVSNGLFDGDDDGVPDRQLFVEERCKVALVTWSVSTRGKL